MTATVSLPPRRGQRPSRARAGQRAAPRWAARAGRDLGLRPTTVETRVHGPVPVQQEVAVILRRLIEEGHPQLLAKVAAPIEAALAGIPVLALDADLICRAAEADEEEAIVRARYQAAPGPVTLKAWRIAIETQRTWSLRLLVALAAEERLS